MVVMTTTACPADDAGDEDGDDLDGDMGGRLWS